MKKFFLLFFVVFIHLQSNANACNKCMAENPETSEYTMQNNTSNHWFTVFSLAARLWHQNHLNTDTKLVIQYANTEDLFMVSPMANQALFIALQSAADSKILVQFVFIPWQDIYFSKEQLMFWPGISLFTVCEYALVYMIIPPMNSQILNPSLSQILQNL
jgi:hypothetical protein